ncbi:MAG: tail fiber domain-containing protein, partial [Patescibacteria group bacterium]
NYAAIFEAGNVGIGTTAPGAKFEVKGTDYKDLVVVGTGTVGAGIGLQSTGTGGRNFAIISTASGSDAGAGKLGFFLEGVGAGYKMVIDTAGNVGIGTMAPTANLQVAQGTEGVGTVSTPGSSTTLTGVGTQFTNTFKVGDTLTVAGETVRTISTITSNTVLDVTVAFSATPRSAVAYTLTGGTRFIVLGNGNVGIGTTTPLYKLDIQENATSYIARFVNDGNNTNRLGLIISTGLDDHTLGSTTNNNLISFQDGDQTAIGSITFGSGVTAYNTSSDERLKENIVETSLSLSLLNQIKVRDFTWISDKEKKLSHGFIAQELNDIYPIAVSVPNNPNDVWMIDYSKLNPLIVKSVQELDLKFVSLEERVVSLEENSFTGDEESIKKIFGEYAGAFFNTVIKKVEDGAVFMKGLVVDTLKIGSPTRRVGVTLYDEITGEPFCISVANGVSKTTAGECVVIVVKNDNSSSSSSSNSSGSSDSSDSSNGSNSTSSG